MRKIIMALIVAVAAMTACTKDNSSDTQTFFVNCYYTYSDHPNYGEKLCEFASVTLYRSTGKGVDKESLSLLSDKVKDTAGTPLAIERTAPDQTGATTFEDIKNGNYVIVIDYADTGFHAYTYKEITVNEDIKSKTFKMVFDRAKHGGFQEWK